MPDIPHDGRPDSTLALLHDGYDFIGKRRERLRSDVFETRLLLQPTLCLTGIDAARLIYDEERFQRATAAPGRMQRTLTGTRGVQSLDGEAHRHRKAMFMALLEPEGTQRLVELARAELRRGFERRRGGDVTLFDLAAEALCRAVCKWSGVPLRESEAAPRTADFVSMIEAGGRAGFAHWRGRLARRRAERWAGALIRRVRDGRHATSVPDGAATGSVLETVARYEDAGGARLDERVAAVELLNVLRPAVAVAYYVTFTALALQSHVEARRALLDGKCEPLWFVQEVRRCYPFFPFVAARTRAEFEWHGYRFPGGTRTLLDLYGTNHDVRSWPAPERFMPERFHNWEGDPFALIPQGAGDTAAGHRCPGETVTIELMRMALDMLTSELRYEAPPQDLRLNRSRIPTLPNSRFVMSEVRLT